MRQQHQRVFNNVGHDKTYLDPMQRGLIVPQNNTILAPEWSMDAIFASILRECHVATSTHLKKLPSPFQNHAFVQIFVAVFLPGIERHILLESLVKQPIKRNTSHRIFILLCPWFCGDFHTGKLCNLLLLKLRVGL
jgi:hypothetical protein